MNKNLLSKRKKKIYSKIKIEDYKLQDRYHVNNKGEQNQYYFMGAE